MKNEIKGRDTNQRQETPTNRICERQLPINVLLVPLLFMYLSDASLKISVCVRL